LIIVADLRQKYTLRGVVLQIFSETRLANPLMGPEGLEAGWRIEISRDAYVKAASHMFDARPPRGDSGDPIAQMRMACRPRQHGA
jgi:hypothetical protein